VFESRFKLWDAERQRTWLQRRVYAADLNIERLGRTNAQLVATIDKNNMRCAHTSAPGRRLTRPPPVCWLARTQLRVLREMETAGDVNLSANAYRTILKRMVIIWFVRVSAPPRPLGTERSGAENGSARCADLSPAQDSTARTQPAAGDERDHPARNVQQRRPRLRGGAVNTRTCALFADAGHQTNSPVNDLVQQLEEYTERTRRLPGMGCVAVATKRCTNVRLVPSMMEEFVHLVGNIKEVSVSAVLGAASFTRVMCMQLSAHSSVVFRELLAQTRHWHKVASNMTARNIGAAARLCGSRCEW
jgi:hypothetical protein